MALPPKRDHRISLEAAATLTGRFRRDAEPGEQRATMFPREVFDSLLIQPGCLGIRIYNGVAEDGASANVLVGVDRDGNDMTSGALYDMGMPCPPYCGGDNELNGD